MSRPPLSHPLFSDHARPQHWQTMLDDPAIQAMPNAGQLGHYLSKLSGMPMVQQDLAGLHAFWCYKRWIECGRRYYELAPGVQELLANTKLTFSWEEPSPDFQLPAECFFVAYTDRESMPPVLDPMTGEHRTEGFYVCRQLVDDPDLGCDYVTTLLFCGESVTTGRHPSYRAVDGKFYKRDDATSYGNLLPGLPTQRPHWKDGVMAIEVWKRHAHYACAFLTLLNTRGRERILTDKAVPPQADPQTPKRRERARRAGKRTIPATYISLTAPEKVYSSSKRGGGLPEHLQAEMRLRGAHIRRQWYLEKNVPSGDVAVETKVDEKGRTWKAVYISISARPATYYVKKTDQVRRIRVRE